MTTPAPVTCVEAAALDEADRRALAAPLARLGLSLDVLWFFDVLAELGRQGRDFSFGYVKVMSGDALLGVAMVGTAHRFDRSTMVAPAHPALRRFVALAVGSSRVDLQACKLEYSIVSPK